jgi:hypothetical protein
MEEQLPRIAADVAERSDAQSAREDYCNESNMAARPYRTLRIDELERLFAESLDSERSPQLGLLAACRTERMRVII